MKQRGIILLEGADGAGKTTLAHELIKQNGGGTYLHAGLTDDPWTLHLDLLRRAIQLSAHDLVVLDRLHLSEFAYGACYRDGPKYPVAGRCLDRLLITYGALTVLCVPRDTEEHIAAFKALRETREEAFRDITKVVRWYHDLVNGNVAYAGYDYGSQLIRFGDFTYRAGVGIYDRFKRSAKAGAELVLVQLGLHRDMLLDWIIDPLQTQILGDPAKADLVFVGEEVSPRAIDPWPFIWPETMGGAAGYLNTILHEQGFDETRAVWVNAIDPSQGSQIARLTFAFPDKRYIALGKVAAGVLANNGIKNVVELRHPQYVRRFHHNDPTYVEEIRKAISR